MRSNAAFRSIASSAPQNAGEFLKLFRGVTALQKATLAASAVLALAAGYLWYQNYLETSPSIPFSELPIEQQQAFRAAMKNGDEAWQFFEREQLGDALGTATLSYAEAYEIHPRNRDAVAALRKTADAVLKEVDDDRARRGEIARGLQSTSRYYLQYAPVVDAAKE